MKKVIYSIFSVSILLFSACTEDRGTTTEVADANNDAAVSEKYIRDYGKSETMYTATTDADYHARSQQLTQQMASDMQLDEASKKRVAAIMYDRERRLGELENRYNYSYSETNRMGGQATNDTEADRNVNNNVTADPMRSNNAGNAYEGNNSLNNEAGREMSANNDAFNSERSTIMSDADKELKAVLTPQQYNKFVQNRDQYSELKYKNGATDTKIKSEGDEMKYKSGDHKIKMDGNETKIKNENEKMKIERKQ